MTATITRHARWLSCAIVILACAAWATPASAIMVKLRDGHYANYDAVAGARTPAPARNFDATFTNLDYSGGPVMPSNTNYAVEWLPANYSGHTPFQSAGSYSHDYLGGVQTFFADMAADSGHTTNSDAVSTQYNDSSGATAAYNFGFGGLLVDTDPLPANGCPANAGHICISDSQIQAELDSFLAAQHLAADLTHEYYLITPPDVASCFDAGGSACSANADQSLMYCAYHSRTVAGYVYANIPDLTGVNGCDPFVTFCPNSTCNYDNGPADGVLSAISHEHNESITDPEPNNAWTDWGSSTGGEIGDKCNNDGFSDPNLHLQNGGSGSDTPYNETIGSDHYLIQMEWSNQTKQCLGAFMANATSASASFGMVSTSGSSATFDASGSTSNPGGVAEYVWQFNDGPGGTQVSTQETTSPTVSHTFAQGAGTYTVALTVMNADGTSNATANNFVVGGSSGTPPTARFTDSAPALQGTSVSFDGTSSTDPNAGGHLTYAWRFGDGATATGATASHTYATAGSYLASLTVTDSATGLIASTSQTVTITGAAYPAPTAIFAPPTGLEGTALILNGLRSTDPNPGGTLSYAWNFGDGTTAAGGGVAHAFQAGLWTVTLTVTDSRSGLSGSVSHLVAISDEAPTAGFSAPSGRAGQAVTFAGFGSDSDGSIVAYSWNFGDGTTGSGAGSAHAYATGGTYTVTLTVVDSSGQSASVSHAVVIAARPPVCVVPKLTGMSLVVARRALGSARCALGAARTPRKPKRGAGRGRHWALVVATQAPAPGTTRPLGTRIALTLVYRPARG